MKPKIETIWNLNFSLLANHGGQHRAPPLFRNLWIHPCIILVYLSHCFWKFFEITTSLTLDLEHFLALFIIPSTVLLISLTSKFLQVMSVNPICNTIMSWLSSNNVNSMKWLRFWTFVSLKHFKQAFSLLTKWLKMFLRLTWLYQTTHILLFLLLLLSYKHFTI